jgi:hypothetical protein
MTGNELKKLCEQYPDFEFVFRISDGNNGKFLNIRDFSDLELCDVGHSDKVVVLTGNEE